MTGGQARVDWNYCVLILPQDFCFHARSMKSFLSRAKGLSRPSIFNTVPQISFPAKVNGGRFKSSMHHRSRDFFGCLAIPRVPLTHVSFRRFENEHDCFASTYRYAFSRSRAG